MRRKVRVKKDLSGETAIWLCQKANSFYGNGKEMKIYLAKNGILAEAGEKDRVIALDVKAGEVIHVIVYGENPTVEEIATDRIVSLLLNGI